MLNDQKVEGAGVTQGAAQDERVVDRFDAVGESKGSGFRQQRHFGQLLTFQPPC